MRASQLSAASLLSYAAYITWTCPCPKVNGCHYKNYFLSVGTATLIILYANDFRVPTL